MNGLLTLLLDVGAWTLGGTVLAPLVAARLHRSSTAAKPICGCGHHLAQHDPTTGECHEFIVIRAANSKNVRCTCRRYVGPIPPELVIAQPLGYTEPGLVALRQPGPKDAEG